MQQFLVVVQGRFSKGTFEESLEEIPKKNPIKACCGNRWKLFILQSNQKLFKIVKSSERNIREILWKSTLEFWEKSKKDFLEEILDKFMTEPVEGKIFK